MTKRDLFEWLNMTVGGNRIFQHYMLYRWIGTPFIAEALELLNAEDITQ